mmetsp:Transcript_7961/g.25408  ORF Transcript_7961/g.25408 Transcript_7961/m.25408 type:complete len:92 (+) Transcript_7961:316-591(+)
MERRASSSGPSTSTGLPTGLLQLVLVVSPSSVLHVIPADQKSTRVFIDKHADIKRHDYFRGMAGLNLNNARTCYARLHERGRGARRRSRVS